jgi:hypothetical protein
MNRKTVAVIAAMLLAGASLTGCISSKRQIDKEAVGAWPIHGTSWWGFCDGRNAVIFVPGKNSSDPDELEAYVYEHEKCVGQVEPTSPAPSTSSKPDADGIIDDED